MAAGPTPEQVSRARRRMVRDLAAQVANKLGTSYRYERGGTAHVGNITIGAHLSRASNGEAAMWAVASSPRGTLRNPPWMNDGATAANIVCRLT